MDLMNRAGRSLVIWSRKVVRVHLDQAKGPTRNVNAQVRDIDPADLWTTHGVDEKILLIQGLLS